MGIQDNEYEFCSEKFVTEIVKEFSCVRLPSESGTLPEKLHKMISSVFKEESFPKEAGNSPEKSLPERYRWLSLVRLPTEGGSFPENEQPLIPKEYKDSRFSIESGILPENLVFESLKSTRTLLL